MANRLKVAMMQVLVTLWRQGWSQRQMARRLGIDRETVARYGRAEKDCHARFGIYSNYGR
jgi:DNA-binding transcriptional regulator LsrR (DeoR family)